MATHSISVSITGEKLIIIATGSTIHVNFDYRGFSSFKHRPTNKVGLTIVQFAQSQGAAQDKGTTYHWK